MLTCTADPLRLAEHRGLEPINRSKTIKLDKHELKALFERNATERQRLTDGLTQRCDSEVGELVCWQNFLRVSGNWK